MLATGQVKNADTKSHNKYTLKNYTLLLDFYAYFHFTHEVPFTKAHLYKCFCFAPL